MQNKSVTENEESGKTTPCNQSELIEPLGHIEIYAEICCEECNEIIHNHFDCPACNRQYAGSEQYGELASENGVTEIECSECHAKFQTTDKWYDENAMWLRVA